MIKTPSSTVIGGAGIWTPNCAVVGAAKAFGDADIQKMFAGGEQGFWLDASSDKIFTDAIGSTQTVVTQQIYTFLDKSRGLTTDIELIKNGDFNAGLNDWVLSSSFITLESGAIKVVTTGAAWQSAYQNFSTGLNKFYTISLKVKKSNSSGSGYITFGGISNDASLFYTIQQSNDFIFKQFFFKSLESSHRIRVQHGSTDTSLYVYADDISVKKVNGYHAQQVTASKRPLLTADGVIFDKNDDQLDVVFDTALTNCTIIRTTKSGGTVVQTGQAVAQNYAITQDFHQLMIINRALTAFESAKVTAYFNKKAGVV